MASLGCAPTRPDIGNIWSEIARAGGLMAYGPTLAELHRRVAVYIPALVSRADRVIEW